ncbi:MAG: hypothetical protein IKV02_02235, partial [Clostridia bacterium]|nr:hypothetical protein [Clostridia bacterium]
LHGAPGALYSQLAMTAAAGKQNDSNDDQPKSAVFKEIAKAVIHNRSSKKSLGEQASLLLCYHIMTKVEKCERKLSFFRWILRKFFSHLAFWGGVCERILKKD